MSNKMSRTVAVAIALVAVLLAGILTVRHWTITREARLELLDFRDSVLKATTKDDIEQLFRGRRYNRLELVQESSAQWIIVTPLEFGASNWYLYLEFTNATLAAAKIRYADSAQMHPSEAPPDVVLK